MKQRGLHWWIRRVWFTAAGLFTAWLIWNVQAHGVADHLFVSSSATTVTREDDMTMFMPAGASAETPAMIFLPGGGVDPDAYVPLVRRLADAGVPVALVKLPWRMAFTDSAQAETWSRVERARLRLGRSRPVVLGGHSRGAALSGHFAFTHAPVLAGLFMVGTTHPRDEDLSSLTFPVLKVAATRDCVADLAAARDNARNLPAATTWVVIEGGNHAQFGYYGSQLGDCSAEIAREDQQDQLFDALLSWMRAIPATFPPAVLVQAGRRTRWQPGQTISAMQFGGCGNDPGSPWLRQSPWRLGLVPTSPSSRWSMRLPTSHCQSTIRRRYTASAIPTTVA